MQTVKLSANAVAALRFEIKGWKAKDPGCRLPAYRELAEAGIMEPVAELEYRFTDEGMKHREAILEREAERIERERYAPPDGNLSGPAKELLRRIVSGRVEVTPENRPTFRELMADRIVMLGHSFANGPESVYGWTYWGWKLRFELVGDSKEKESA
jgi:hypothetical protein